MPKSKLETYMSQCGLTELQAKAFLDDPALDSFYWGCLTNRADPSIVASVMLNVGMRIAASRKSKFLDLPWTPDDFELIALQLSGGSLHEVNVEAELETCLKNRGA